MTSKHTSEILDEIDAEREKQRAKWGDAHDDEHEDGTLAAGAAVLAHPENESGAFGPDWAWERRTTETRRRQLVIAAALIVSEIERLDRAAGGA